MPAPPRQPLTAGTRRNAYTQRCRLCGTDVAAGAGWLEGSPGAWTVIHEVCPHPSIQTTANTTTTATQPYTVTGTTARNPWTPPPLVSDVPAGHYAVPSETGNNDLDFFRVDRPTEGQYAGRIYVKRVIGGRPAQRIGRVPAQRALDRIAEHGVGAAARLYGAEIGRCYRCNRHLTDQTSRTLGIGPDCRRQHGEIDAIEPWPVITEAPVITDAQGNVAEVRATLRHFIAERSSWPTPTMDELNIIGGQTEDPLVSELGTGELL